MADDRRNPMIELPDELTPVDAALRSLFRAEAADRRASQVLELAVDAIPDRTAPRTSRWSGRWLPAPWAWSPLAPARIALLAVLLLALIAAGILAGSRLRPVPPPFGLAGTGQMAFDAAGDVWVAGPDGAGAHPLARTPAADWGATWSRDGRYLAFWSGDRPGGPATLWVTSADGSDMREVAPGRQFSVPIEAPAVSWSGDGGRVAFATVAGELYVAAVDGSALSELTAGSFAAVATPAWSPGGDRIAFRGLATGTTGQGIFVIGPDGTGLEAVSPSGPAGGGSHLLADWSPDGTRIAYSNGDGDIVVAERTASGWDERVVVGGPANDLYPAWAPDGRRLAFVRSDDTITDARWSPEGNDAGWLMVVDADGGPPALVGSTLVAAAPTHCFSPDGSTLRALLAQRGIPLGVTVVPRYGLIDVASAQPLGAVDAAGTAAWAACAWQRVAR